MTLLCVTRVTGIIYIVCERSRRKPVDEDDAKLGRWVATREITKLTRAMWYHTHAYIYHICITRYSLDITPTVYRISFILLHMYSTLCFGNSSATLSCHRTFASVASNLRSHVRNVSFFLTTLFFLFPLHTFSFSLMMYSSIYTLSSQSRRDSARGISRGLSPDARTCDDRSTGSRAVENDGECDGDRAANINVWE